MARPKTLKKPRKKPERHTAKHLNCNTTGTSTTTVTWRMPEQQIRIESLDEGQTWHTTDTMEPTMNWDGQLVIGSVLCGRAPESMRPGSGNYSFEITSRGARLAEEAETDRLSFEITSRGARLAEEAETDRLWKERKAKREKARVRARELLLSHLTRTQKADLETKDGFWVTSQFENRYWVTRSANPGQPGPWDIAPRVRPQMIDAGGFTPVDDYVQVAENPPRRMREDYRQVTIPAVTGFDPILVNVNGVVRPLTG